MNPSRATRLLVVVGSLFAATASGAIVNIAHFPLGEPGSVGGSQPYTPLTDVVGSNQIPSWNTEVTKTSLTSSGLVAPGSTAALVISGNAGQGGTWYGGSLNSGSGLTDNWAFDIYLRPDDSGGSFLGATDGNASAATGLRFWATNTTVSGTTLGGNTLSTGSNYLLLANGSGFLGDTTSTYSAGSWVRLTAIRHTGTVYYYLNEVLQDSATTDGFVNDIRLGAGYSAVAGTNGGFDELRLYTFDASDPVGTVAATVFAVPEPRGLAAAAGGLATIGVFIRRRR